MQKPFVRLQVRQRFSDKQNQIRYLQGQIGDGEGKIETGTPNKIYCRVGDQVVKAWAFDVPRVYGLSVYIVNSTKYPGDLEIDSGNAQVNAIVNAHHNNVAAHAREHMWLGRDPVFVHLRQFMPLWIGTTGDPATPYSIRIGAGLVWTGTGVAEVPTQVLDLSAHVPAGDTTTARFCRYVLVTVSTAAVVVATPGAVVAEAGFGLDDVPAAPAGTAIVLGAVRLYSDQIAIAEARDRTDIIDLRYPYRHTHLPAEVGGHDAVTVADTATVDMTLTGQQISAAINQAGLDPANMSSGAAASGQVPTANGAGGIAWGAAGGHDPVTLGANITGVLGLTGQQIAAIVQTANKVLASPDGASGAPGFRKIVSGDINSGALLAGLSLKTDGSGGSLWQAEHAKVSMSAAADSILSIGDTSQQITVDSQAANRVFAGPASGANAPPNFRLLAATDLPAHTHASSDVTPAPALELDTVTSNPTYDSGGMTIFTRNNSLYALNQAGVPANLSGAGNAGLLMPLMFYNLRALWTMNVAIIGGTSMDMDHGPNAEHLTRNAMTTGLVKSSPGPIFAGGFNGSTSYLSRALDTTIGVRNYFLFGCWVYLDAVNRSHGVVRMGTTAVSWTIYYSYVSDTDRRFEMMYTEAGGTSRVVGSIQHNTAGWVYVEAVMYHVANGNNRMWLKINDTKAEQINAAWEIPRTAVGDFELGRAGNAAEYLLLGKMATAYLSGGGVLAAASLGDDYYNATRGYFQY